MNLDAFFDLDECEEYNTQKNRIVICRGEGCAKIASSLNIPVVIIDVLRASTTIITALEHGAKEVIPVLEVEEAREIAKRHGLIAGGERNSRKIDGFDKGNSPYDYMDCEGKGIVFTSTNCTKVIYSALTAPMVLIGALINARAIVSTISSLPYSIVALIMAGTKGKPSLEDKIGASVIARLACKLDAYDDYYSIIKNSEHAQELEKIGCERDVKYASRVGISNAVPILKDSTIVPGKKALVRFRI